MAIIKNAIDFGSGFNIKSQGPIDSRMIVEYISDLTTVWDSDSPVYVGMIVSVLEDGNVYVLRNKDYTDINNWKKQGSGSETGIGKYSLPIMTEEMKNASKTKELSEEDVRSYFKCNATEPKEKAPKKPSVKFAFDEISDFFPDMQPKEVKDKIIEILFAWYDAQQNAVMNEPTELDNVIMSGGESY